MIVSERSEPLVDRKQLYIETEPVDEEDPSPWYVAAWLTVPRSPTRSELQILVHGAGGDHRYWDWPVQPDDYSYVSWAAARGIATLNLDRVGSGYSSHPRGAANTIAAQAAGLSQIVGAAKRGLAGTPPFRRVILVGHSLGSLICGYEAAVHADVDAAVLTGYLPTDGRPENEDRLLAAFVPATAAFPHLRGLIDADYLVAHPRSREPLMYHSPQADPAIIEIDEQMKGTTTTGELRGTSSAGPTIRGAGVPVLVVAGQYDALLIDSTLGDQNCFDSVARVEAVSPSNFEFEVVADTGHNLNLHRNAHESYEIVNRWLYGLAPDR
jgi:pimeloyl-ACP methyl ester carboxylesterase